MGELGSYRWMVVGVSTAVNALAWGARSTFALFYVAILEEFAWGRGPTALGYSLSWLCFVVFAPAAGWLRRNAGLVGASPSSQVAADSRSSRSQRSSLSLRERAASRTPGRSVSP